jgi:hypothetical protein
MRSVRDQIVKCVRLGIHQVQTLRTNDSLLLSDNVSHRNIMGNGREERICKPIREELVQNWSLNQPSSPSPLINMIIDVGGRGLSE